MRLWSLHPSYLDAKGLVALWREALLAQAVLRGQTRGYTRHPQLQRFRDSRAPVAAIAAYLSAVHAESVRRDYRFDAGRIGGGVFAGPLTVTRGQMSFEWCHLMRKLADRDPVRRDRLAALKAPRAHPLFRIVPGAVAEWEAGPGSRR